MSEHQPCIHDGRTVTREEVHELARQVIAGKSRSYVQDSDLFAHWILEVAESERKSLQQTIDALHNRCCELLERLAAEYKRELSTEPDLRAKK